MKLASPPLARSKKLVGSTCEGLSFLNRLNGGELRFDPPI
jgi:hypothetical protein